MTNFNLDLNNTQLIGAVRALDKEIAKLRGQANKWERVGHKRIAEAKRAEADQLADVRNQLHGDS